MKKCLMVAVVFSVLSILQAATVGDVGVSAGEDGCVIVTYALDADAIITADVRTNGVSVGGERQWSLSGDVHRLVAAGENKRIVWHPRADFPEAELKNVSVEVAAWAESDAPDYMVADLLKESDRRIRYFTSADFLPGGIVSNEYYRMYAVPFRKIRAKGVTWTMGTTSELGRTTSGNETAHEVTLDRNYYIAVFETTKAQGEAVGSTKSADCTHSNTDRWRLTPVGRSPWNSWRGAKPPEVPTAGSILGKFTGRIGFQIDLPLESQWEFAARGGHGEGTWGDGSKILKTENSDANLNRLSINKYNKSAMTETGTCATNSYGLYDMHGNIAEFCQDWYQADITGLNGALCAYPGDSSRRADGLVGTNRVVRGGYYGYNPSGVRASYRGHVVAPGSYKTEIGARLMTYANLGEEVAPTSSVSTNTLAAIDTRSVPPAAAATESAIEIRTFNEVVSSAFSIDTLTPAGLVVIIR